MGEEVKRIPICKYVKSGKIAGILSDERFKGYTVIDMSPDLRRIEKIRSVNYFKSGSIESTDYILEAIENVQRVEGDKYGTTYQILRILTSKDLDEERWKTTESLTDLPVGSHEHISKEERIWAGERDGNIGSGLALAVWTFVAWFILYIAIKSDGLLLFIILTAAVTLPSTYFLVTFKWRPHKKASADKIAKLNTYKEKLRIDAKYKEDQAKTELEKMLQNYSNWEQLSPKDFEYALKFKLKNKGYNLRVTNYTGDGGVDLEGVNNTGQAIIIQAKKHSSNVGVAVVREMIGVRESHPEKPLAMVISLVGFTKGALQLAEQEGIILKSIKEDIIIV